MCTERKKKQWISDNALELELIKKNAVNCSNEITYRELRKEVQRSLRADTQNEVDKISVELEVNPQRRSSRLVFSTIKELTSDLNSNLVTQPLTIETALD